MSLDTSASLQREPVSRVPRFLRPAPALEVIESDPKKIERGYAKYQPKILFWSTVGYAMFYFVRKNISVAMPVMEKQLGISKSSLGLFLTLHGVLYGVSKFANGFLGDRANARMMMALGLITSAIMNVFFGFNTAVIWLGIFWMINGWCQGLGYPPCARLLTHWFEPKEMATKMSLWNTSHTIGGAAILILCGYLAPHDWRLCFFVPAALAIVMAMLLIVWLRDTPESVGLPEVKGTVMPAAEDEKFGITLAHRVFGNRFIWLFSIANFFVYTIRYAVLDWGPTILKENKGLELTNAAWMVAGFEVAGLAGILVSGWLTDRFFAGKASRMSALYMILCGVSLFFFWKSPAHYTLRSTLLLASAGFFVYGPQALIGVAAANLATKRAAATAVGLTGFFGYISTVLSGWGLGYLAQHEGWDAVFICLLFVAGIGTFLFLLTWPAKANGYGEA